MSHYAKIEDGIVTEVIVADKEFVSKLEGKWVQTSYNHKIRGNFAGKGYTYNEKLDKFIRPKMNETDILNEKTWQWEKAPVEMSEE